MPAMGESVSEGVILEWAKQPGDAVAEDETIVEISTDKVDAEVPAPAVGHDGEILAEAGDTVTVGQVIAPHDVGGNGAAPAKAAPTPEPTRDRARPATTPSRSRTPDGIEGHAGRAAASPPRTGVDLAQRPRAPAPTAASARPTCSRARRTAPAPPPRRRPPQERDADQGRVGDARALHGRVAVDPDRDLVPHAHRHHARRAAASSSRRPATRSPSPT